MKNAENFLMTQINDVYFISKFLQKLDPDLCLMYCQSIAKYVVYDKAKNQIVITYDRYPDAGLIAKLYVTSKENIFKYLSEVERKNQELEVKELNDRVSKAKDKLSAVFNFAQSSGKNLGQKQIRKIISEE